MSTAAAALDAAIAATPAVAGDDAPTVPDAPIPTEPTPEPPPGEKPAEPASAAPDKMTARFEALAKLDKDIREGKKVLESEKTALAPFRELRDALASKDAPKFFELMSSAGFAFDDAVVAYADHLAAGGKPEDAASKTAREVTELQKRLDAKDKEIADGKQTAQITEMNRGIADKAKSDPIRWELCVRDGAPTVNKVSVEVAEAWLELGSPTWTTEDFAVAVETALDATERSLEETGKKYTKTSKTAAKPEDIVKGAQDTPRSVPRTISSTIGGAAPINGTQIPKRMSRDEAVSFAIAQGASQPRT